jgi:hypothetical protein
MNRVKYLFVLFILLKSSTELYSQEISFYYDELVGNTSVKSTTGQLIENLTRQFWHESTSSWENDSLYEYSYNNKNLVDTLIAHKWRYATTWGNDGRWRYLYNSNSKLVSKNRDVWATTYWRDDFRNYFYYDVNQNLSRMDYSSYYENTWVLYGYYIYSWNSNNNLLNITNYTLSTIGPWIYFPTGKEDYYYDSTDVLIMKTELWSFYGYVWFNDINDLYFYDQNGNNNENIRQEWNDTDSIWVNDYRYLYEYDIDNVLLSIVYQDWQQDSLDWENVWRESYTYSPQNNIATMFKETWTPETGWNNYVLRNYSYDVNYNWTEKLTLLWDGTNWNNYYRHLATWIEPVSVWETPGYIEEYYLSNNYPNPFNPSTKINFQIPISGFVTLKVYDILGNEIAILVNEEKEPGTYEVEFSAISGSTSGGNNHSGGVRTLPSGIYFYILSNGNISISKKMVLIK